MLEGPKPPSMAEGELLDIMHLPYLQPGPRPVYVAAAKIFSTAEGRTTRAASSQCSAWFVASISDEQSQKAQVKESD